MVLLEKRGCRKGIPYTFREPSHLNRNAALDVGAGRLGLYVTAMLNVPRVYGLSPQWMHTVPNPRRWYATSFSPVSRIMAASSSAW